MNIQPNPSLPKFRRANISFFKKFWPQRGPRWGLFGLIAIVLIIIGLILFNHDDNGKNIIEKIKDNNEISKNPVLSSDLPACPADTSNIFTYPIMDGDKPDFITPLGNSNPSGHVVPVDHVYPSDIGLEKDMPVYAPGNMTLVWVENKQMHNSDTNEITRADYQLNFAPCKGINFALIHIKVLSPKLKEAVGDENSDCDNSQKMEYGMQEGIPTYYVTCHPDIKKVQISAGELIGYFSGQSDREFSGFDIGIYDFNKPALNFVNPDRYYVESVHTACFADYYTKDLRSKYLAKMGGYDNITGSDEREFIHPTKNTCGKVMWDVKGTLAGNWFKNPIKRSGQTTDSEALVLIYDNIKPELAKISWAEKNVSFTFTPTHSGTINREFSETANDNKVYCYQNDENAQAKYVDKNGQIVTKDPSKYLLQLIDDNHVKVEQQAGVCSENENFISPLIYQR